MNKSNGYNYILSLDRQKEYAGRDVELINFEGYLFPTERIAQLVLLQNKIELVVGNDFGLKVSPRHSFLGGNRLPKILYALESR